MEQRAATRSTQSEEDSSLDRPKFPHDVLRVHASLFAKALVTILCIVSLLDLSWMGLQVYAWAKMVQDRPTDIGWTQAIADAISGDDPCKVCLYIQSAQGKEQDNQRATNVKQSLRQPMSLCTGISVQPATIIGTVNHFHREESRLLRRERPPVPPPKQLG